MGRHHPPVLQPRCRRSPFRCSKRSTPSSARSPRRCADRCGCWPAPAPARPGRSPTGSRTASPRASTRPPRSWRCPFTTRAAGEMRDRLRALGAPGVQARTFHSAALRQLRFFWPRVHGRELPELTESKLGDARARPRAGSGSASTRPSLRDLASEIEWAKVCNVSPDDYATDRRDPAAARSSHLDARGRWPAPSRPTRRSSAARAGWTWRTCCSSPPACSPTTKRSPPRSAGSTSGSSSTSSRTSRPSSTRCSTCGSAAATSSASSATRPRRSTPSPAPTRATCATSPSASPRPPASSWSATTARPRRSWPGRQPAAGRHAQQGCRPRRPAARRRPRSPTARPPTRSPRPTAVADRIAALRSAGTPAERDGHPVPHQRAVRALRGGPGRAQDPLRRPRRGPLLRPGRGAAGASPCSAAPRAAARRRVRHRAGRGHPLRRWATRPSRPRAGESPQPLGVAAGAGRPGRPTSPASIPRRALGDFVDDLDRRAGEQHAPVADAVTLATIHSAKGLEWDAVFLAGMQENILPITSGETPAEIEEERRLLYVAMTRARNELTISWAPARNPGGRVTRGSSPFLAPLLDGVPACPRSAATTRKRNRKARHCRECGGALSSAVGEEDRPLHRLPGVLRRGALRAAAGVAPGARRARTASRPSSCSPTRPSSSSPSTRPATRRACARSVAWGPASWPSTATTCSPLVAGTAPQRKS